MNTREVFASLVAQHENLGDVALRQQMVERVSTLGRVNVLAVNCPQDYLSGVDLPGNARVFRSRLNWSLRLFYGALRRRSVLVYSPGPQLLEDRPKVIFAEVLRICTTVFLRLLGAKTIRLGRSFEGSGRLMRVLVGIHTRVLSLAVSRDSRVELGFDNCIVMPDLVFGGGDPEPVFSGKYLAVSLRFDKGVDLDVLAIQLANLATTMGLSPIVVSQVLFDVPQNQRLADLLGAQHVGAWGGVRARLESVAEAYRESQIVLSDRLHALVIGLTYGAVPWLLHTGSPHKLVAAMSEIGLDLVSCDPRHFELVEAPVSTMSGDANEALIGARDRLRHLDEMLASAVGTAVLSGVSSSQKW